MAMGVCSLVAAQIIASVVVSLAAGATLPVRSVSSWPTSFGNVNQTADGSYSTNWVSSRVKLAMDEQPHLQCHFWRM